MISPRFDALIDARSTTQPFKLGLLGGTFDPVHYGHLLLAEQACEQFVLDGVLFVPAGQPVRKLGTGFADAAHRYHMLVASTQDNPLFDVSRVELDRPGVTYTVDTLRTLAQQYGGKAALFFITGADATADMATWKAPQEIARLATILSANRVCGGGVQLDTRGEGPDVQPDTRTFTIPTLALSSQDIRFRLAAGCSVRYLVPEPARLYLKEHSLYV
ncbi:MAG: nicotinate-nucleotide adenylyltransferase [Coriobacteriales bacterium]|nr:nicotinate-nucleotide adenylyltransferase [Coriobacteriales bacterium]